VTLFLAALGWYITHAVDRARQLPLVEALIAVSDTDAAKGEHRATLEIENLSDKLFQNLSLQIIFSGGPGVIIKPVETVAFAPAVPMKDEPLVVNNGMSFTLPWLQPENRLKLVFTYRGGGTPQLVVAGSSVAIMVVKPSLRTFFVRYELEMLFGLILAFAVVTTASIALAPSETESDT
jgi:hypothetical protein